MLTLLRPDCRAPHHAGNAMLVPRFKWLCIELARCREGLNDAQVLAKHQPEPEEKQDLQQAMPAAKQNGKQQQLVMRRTRLYSAIGVDHVAGAAAVKGEGDEEDEEDVEKVVEALMAQQGIGEDASEEGKWGGV